MRLAPRLERLLLGWMLLASSYVLAVILTRTHHHTYASLLLVLLVVSATILTVASIRWFIDATHALAASHDVSPAPEIAQNDEASDAS